MKNLLRKSIVERLRWLFLWGVLGLALIVPSVSEADEKFSYAKVWKKIAPAIVGIRCDLPGVGGFFGTGTIIQEDGLILTSTCVVPPNSTNIKVRLFNRQEVTAQIVLIDEETEAVLLDIEENNLPALMLGDSDHVKPGETVYTFGNVLGSITGLGGESSGDDKAALSVGVVSGIYSLQNQGPYHLEEHGNKYKGVVIETTAAINGGVDGGPLIDQHGTIIGLISLGYSHARKLGVAIPINIIKPIIKNKLTNPPKEKLELPIPPSYTHIVEKASHAIVGIHVTYIRKPPSELPPEPPPSQPDRPPRLPPEALKALREYSTRPEGLSSGVVIDTEGHILTSYHNIKGEISAITVTLQTDTQKIVYSAELLGWDQNIDLALLKIKNPPRLNPITLPGKTSLKVGAIAIVVGNNPDPTMNQPTVDVGIVSALGRNMGKAFQLDAAINFVNYGAPVFDLDGKFIGLVGQYVPPAEWGINSGVGWAVTIEAIRKVLPELKAGKKIEKTPTAFLGVQLARGALDIHGAKVEQVVPNSAAQMAGIQPNDIIIQVDHTPIKDWISLVRAIRSYKPGDEVKIKIKRAEEIIELTVKLGKRE